MCNYCVINYVIKFRFTTYNQCAQKRFIFGPTSRVSPGLNGVRGAHGDEQQSLQPGARREARGTGRAS